MENSINYMFSDNKNFLKTPKRHLIDLLKTRYNYAAGNMSLQELQEKLNYFEGNWQTNTNKKSQNVKRRNSFSVRRSKREKTYFLYSKRFDLSFLRNHFHSLNSEKISWREVTLEEVKTTKTVDFVFYDYYFRSVHRLFYTVSAFLKNEFDSDSVSDKNRLHCLVQEKLPFNDFMPLTVQVDAKTKIKPGEIKILRPAHGWAGFGVEMVTRQDQLNEIYQKHLVSDRNSEILLLSDYITDPYLYEGRKQTLRIFVLVCIIFGELYVYMFEKGVVRLARKKFTLTELTKDVHVANFASTGQDLIYPDTLKNHCDFSLEQCTEKMKDILKKVFSLTAQSFRPYQESACCYKLLGVDFMLTQSGDVKLIEINKRTGFHLDDPNLNSQNSQMISDGILKAAILPAFYNQKPQESKNMSLIVRSKSYFLQTQDMKVDLIKDYFDRLNKGGVFDFNTVRSRTESQEKNCKELHERKTDQSSDVVVLWRQKTLLDLKRSPQPYCDFVFHDFDAKFSKFFYQVQAYAKNDFESSVLTNKAKLHGLIQTKFPHFVPYTFRVKGGEQLKEDSVWIWREARGWAGKGNHFVVSQQQYDQLVNEKIKKAQRWSKTRSEIIMSKYILDPLLIFQRKTTFRINVLHAFPGTQHEKVYMFNSGIVRLAEQKYQQSNFTDFAIHDAHFSSTGQDLFFPQDLEDLTDLNLRKCQEQIIEILRGVFSLSQFQSYPESQESFKLFGVDFMITVDGRVYLIEINRRPSFKMWSEQGKKQLKETISRGLIECCLKPLFENKTVTVPTDMTVII